MIPSGFEDVPRALGRWFREADGRHRFGVDTGPEFRRLLDAANEALMPLWLLGQAAEIVAQRRGCDQHEAWDRVACAIEGLARRRGQGGRMADDEIRDEPAPPGEQVSDQADGAGDAPPADDSEPSNDRA